MRFKLSNSRLVGIKRIQVSKGNIAFHMTRVFNFQMQRVGVHALYRFGHFVSRCAQVDDVAQGFTHFGFAINARQTAQLWHQGFGFHQNFLFGAGIFISAVKAAYDLVGLLNHRDLVFTHRHQRRFKGGNVRGLANRVGEKTRRNIAFKITQANLFFHGRVTLQARHGDQVQVVKRQLGQLRDL